MLKYLQCTICKAIELAPKFSHQKTFLCKKCNELKVAEDLLYNSEEVLPINQIEEFLVTKGFSKSVTGILYKEYSKNLRISINISHSIPTITIKDGYSSHIYIANKILKFLPRNIVIETKPVINTIINLWSQNA